MHERAFTSSTDLSPARLTELLTAKGMLEHGSVKSIHEVGNSQSIVSTHHRFAVQYDQAAVGPFLPAALLLKLSNPNFPADPVFDQLEPRFYNHIVPELAVANWSIPWPFVPSVDAVWSTNQMQWHVLLVDMSESHVRKEGYLPPSPELFAKLVDVFAHFHAFWWAHPKLGTEIGSLLTDADIDASEQETGQRVMEIADLYQSDLTAEEFSLLQRVAPNWPKSRRTRAISGHGLTLVHRDPHQGNVLYPRGLDDSNKRGVLLIDWQSWRVDFATDDLAYAMAFHWPAALRADLEESMLRRYHARIVALGVTDYSWDDLLYDYRASILRFIGIMAKGWRHQFNRARLKLGLEACGQWECEDILER